MTRSGLKTRKPGWNLPMEGGQVHTKDQSETSNENPGSMDDLLIRWMEKYVFTGTAGPSGNEIPEVFHRKCNTMEVNESPFRSERTVLERSSQMTNLLSHLIEEVKADEKSCGLVYLMFWSVDDHTSTLSPAKRLVPLYFGIAERMDQKRRGISENLRNPSFFARWGYSKFYHMGDLSEALKNGVGRHADWAKKLFAMNQPPTLLKPVYFWARSWRSQEDHDPMGSYCHLTNLERQLIQLAKRYPDNLNKRIPRTNKPCRCMLWANEVGSRSES